MSTVLMENVRKVYGDSVALDGISLEVAEGEAVAVMGPSGCGKSTLLNLVAGLDRATTGRVVVNGVELGELSEKKLALFRRREIGMVFQFGNLIDDLSALDNVALAGQLGGRSVRRARSKAGELLERLGVASRGKAYPAVLSGGERQRVGVARALMNEPGLLLADEPTGALDSRSGAMVAGLLRDLNRMGHTLLLVTHDRALAEGCSTRMVEVLDGRIARESRIGSAA